MKTPANRFWFWPPRIIGLLFAVFISVFALDVFEEHHDFWNTAIALLLHLIPAAILILILAVAWRWERCGALLYLALGAFYLIAFWGRFHWSAYAIISGTLGLLGVLFILSWKTRIKLKPKIDG